MTELLTVFTIPDAIGRIFTFGGINAANYKSNPYYYDSKQS